MAQVMKKLSASARSGDLIGTFLLAYLIMSMMIAALVYVAGIWKVLANTRLLDLLISGGFIKYHDKQVGFIQGIPDVKDYLLANDPIDWRLMMIVVLLLLFQWLLKAVQFHGIARFNGLSGDFGDHTRALFYGAGLNNLLPYNIGELATTMALEGQGQGTQNSLRALFMMKMFFVFEILFYVGLAGIISLGWAIWFTQVFWGVVIFLVIYFFMRGTQATQPTPLLPMVEWGLNALAQEPLKLVGWCLISLLSFFLEHLAVYLVVMSFTSQYVILNVEFSMLVMALAGGYLARLIIFTPGGIGQFEWGFAAALYLGGMGFPEAATIALLFGLVRYAIGALLTLIVRLTYGIETNVSAVMARFARTTDVVQDQAGEEAEAAASVA